MVIWEGKSPFTDAEIFVVVTESDNRKTGQMLQTWILVQEMNPVEAIKMGLDLAICNNCAMRGLFGKERPCYVNYGQAPGQVWRKWFAREYAYGMWDTTGRMVRLGAYGDPVAVPLGVWYDLLKPAKGHTGYTHQWRTCDPEYSKLVMASVETPADAELAHSMGWRTFRIKLPEMPVLHGEFVCPASNECGHRLTCEECGACSGGKPPRASVVIDGHGGSGVLPVINRYLRSINGIN